MLLQYAMIVFDHRQIAGMFKYSSLQWFASLHFHSYEDEIFVINSLHANVLLMIELEVFCCTYGETIFAALSFCALQDTMLRTEHVQYCNIHFSSFEVFLCVASSSVSFLSILKKIYDLEKY